MIICGKWDRIYPGADAWPPGRFYFVDMKTKIDQSVFDECVKSAEAKGGLANTSALVERVMELYEQRAGVEITYSQAYKRIVHMPRKTTAGPAGRRREPSPLMKSVLKIVQSAARGWQCDDERWDTLNALRREMGLHAVEPVNRPRPTHFV